MKRIYLLCLPLLCITFSYQTPDFDEQAEIAAAQAWYESIHSGAVFLDQSLQPDWSGAQVVRPKSDRLLIDVPLTGGNQFTYTSNNASTGQIANETRYGATRLVITKFGENQYIALLLHVFGTPAYANEFGQAAAALNRPHNIQSNFTGHMVYTQLDGEAFYGLYIENGQVIASLTPSEESGSISRGCSLEEICMGYFESLICITFILCEVNEGGGGGWTTIGGSGEIEWWANGPIDHCIGCLGGGFTPPTCPDGSLMPLNGVCLCSDGSPMPSNGECPQGPCQLKNTYVTAHGPWVDEYFVGVIPFPWNAFTDVAGILTNCENGDANYVTTITSQTGGVTLNSSIVLPIIKTHYPSTKTWGVNANCYADFLFEVEIAGYTFSTTASDEIDAYFDFKYN